MASWHPLVVHAPLVLLPLATLLAGLEFLVPPSRLRFGTLHLLALGARSAFPGHAGQPDRLKFHDQREILGDEDERLTGDDRREAEQRPERARIWTSGLEAIPLETMIPPRQLYVIR
jgi:hypothetical protein